MKTLSKQVSQQAKHLPTVKRDNENRYGTVQVQALVKDEVYTQILNHTKEFVNWVPPMRIVHESKYMKIELTIPGISKDDCKIGCTGSLLWMRIRKGNPKSDQVGTFYRTFVLTEEIQASRISACYLEEGVLIVIIPRVEAEMERAKNFRFYF